MAFAWRKLGRVFSPQHLSRPWMAAYAQAPGSLLLDDAVRMYFSCRPAPDSEGNFVSYSAWVDLDRTDLTRVMRVAEEPVLPLGDVGEFDQYGTYPISVARDGDRVIAYYGGWTRCVSVPFDVAIGFATSTDDGTTFRKLGRGPILSASPDEPYVISGPKIRRFRDRWWLFYIAGRTWKVVDGRPEPVYRIRMAVSDDGMHWVRANRDLIPSRIEADEAQASPDVIEAGGRYHMFFAYRASTNFRVRDGGYRIGYAWSTDLDTWTRDDTQAGIDVSEDGWDSEMVSYPHVFTVGEETYLAYLGNDFGRDGFGLAVLDGTLASG